MIVDNMIAYAEVDEILKLLEDTYIEKIPEKIRNFFKEERDKDYKPQINMEKPLIEQNLKRETIILLTILNLNYWCEDEEKQELLNELAKNEKEKREIEEKYNPNNLFKNKINNDIDNSNEESLQMVEYKEQNWIKKLLNKIKNFFKKGN